MGLRQRRRSAEPTVAKGPPTPDRAWVSLKDAGLSGWFNFDTGELFPGFPVGPGDTVVDVGCGDGANLNFCVMRQAPSTGIDISSDALHQAGERLSGHHDKVSLQASSAEDLPLPDASASRVICAEVLEHVADPAEVMAELVRVTEPDGLLLITVPDEVGEMILGHVADPAYFQAPNHIRVFRRQEFAALVEGNGLEIISHTTYGFFWTVWWGLFWGAESGPVAGAELDHRNEILDEWTQLWSELMDRPSGEALKARLDGIAPKTQVIVARRPGPREVDT